MSCNTFRTELPGASEQTVKAAEEERLRRRRKRLRDEAKSAILGSAVPMEYRGRAEKGRCFE